MSRPRVASAGLIGRFPRVSGDEPTQGFYQTVDAEFSPRERG